MEKNLAEITKKRQVFFEDFISHYNSTNRGIIGENNCSYSAGCAIGRVIDHELAMRLDVEHGNPSVRKIFLLLPMELQELGKDFLQEIQEMHDSSGYWSKNGLSQSGKLLSEHFKEKWCI